MRPVCGCHRRLRSGEGPTSAAPGGFRPLSGRARIRRGRPIRRKTGDTSPTAPRRRSASWSAAAIPLPLWPSSGEGSEGGMPTRAVVSSDQRALTCCTAGVAGRRTDAAAGLLCVSSSCRVLTRTSSSQLGEPIGPDRRSDWLTSQVVSPVAAELLGLDDSSTPAVSLAGAAQTDIDTSRLPSRELRVVDYSCRTSSQRPESVHGCFNINAPKRTHSHANSSGSQEI